MSPYVAGACGDVGDRGSYTKVAYRPTCVPQEPGIIEKKEAKVLMIDNSPLIPSLAIRTRNANQPWVFGRQAAGMNPSQEMQVFQNWKADLFRPQNDKDSVTAAIIAHRFFEWLRSKLETMGIDVTKCQTRVAMPAFDTFDENAVLIARCMDLSGWNDPTLILKVREPHANTLGLFTDGRNAVRRNGTGECWASKPEMFDDGVYQNNLYMRALRQYLLSGTHGNLLTVMRVVSVNDGEGANGTEAQRPWRQTGEGLQRLATALGGASVILQEAAVPVQRDRAGLHERLVEPPPGYKTCRCQGGNKDCCFCDGRGFYPNR